MVYSLQDGLKALQGFYQQLSGVLAGQKEKVDVYNKNVEQVNILGQLKSQLQDPQNPNRGLVPGLERAQRGATSNNPDAVIDAYKDGKDAKKQILEIGKNYIKKAKGELQNILVGIFSHLYGAYSMAYKQAQYTANGPAMKPKVAERIKDAASILK